MSNTRLYEAHREAPELTPVSTWLLTRLVIAGAALLSLTAFALLVR